MSKNRLELRIVTLFLGLLLAVQAATFFLIRRSIDTNARSALEQTLDQGELVFRRLLAQSADHLVESTRVLAADYGFRSAIASNDQETVASALANHGERVGASIALFADTRFKLKASAGVADTSVLPVLAHLAAQAQGDEPRQGLVLLHEAPYQLVAVPVRAPLPIGWVVMGFKLNGSLLKDMRQLTSMDVAILRRDTGRRWHLALGELPAVQSGELLQRWDARGPDSERHLLARLGGIDHLAHYVALSPSGGDEIGALLLRSVDEAVAPYHRLQLAILGLTVVGLMVFAAGSAVTARRITTPLSALTRLARRLGSGDYEAPVPQHTDDEIGELAEAFESMRLAMHKREAEIRRLAFTDGLTLLPNRVQFSSDVRDAVHHAVAAHQPCAVLMLDLDRFKHVNDVLGHDMGDRMLCEVAKRLQATLPDDAGIAARLGGDEFGVLLYRADAQAAQLHAQRIIKALEEPFTLHEHRADLGASVGIASCPEHAAEPQALVRRAELAMYRAKQAQVGTVIFQPDLDMSSAQSLSMLSELRAAVSGGQLRVYLQPKVSLQAGRVIGAEALVRWQHPERGLVPPMQFIPFAEQTGFIRVLTTWLIEQCAQICAQWNREGLALQLSLNLSARDLIDQDLPNKLSSMLGQYDLRADALCLEITESSIMDDPQRALNTLQHLHDLGLRLAIDDFGTGYSSLAYLKRLPVDELKIDKSFVMNMERDVDDAKIVRSTIDLAHNLGLEVIAEGIETPQAWLLLKTLACDQAQGYWIAKPMPQEQFVAWAKNWAAPAEISPLPSAFDDLV